MRLRAVAILAACGCHGGASSPAATTVAGELVEAGCVLDSPTLVASVQTELATSDAGWVRCMSEGGSVQQCNAPCERAGLVRRPLER